MYSLYEYNKAKHMKAVREEGWEEGHRDGQIQERNRIIISMLNKGKSATDIAELCDCSVEEVMKLKR